VSFGHAAYFGVGAYTLALLSPKVAAAGLWSSLALAIGVAALCALVVGVFVLRTRGIYFIMVTLAFAQMFYFVFHDTKIGGGSDGRYVNVKPDASIAGFTPFDLDKPVHVYYVVLVVLLLVFAFLQLCCARRSGARCRGSARTSSACARSGSRSRTTSSPRSRSPARSRGSPATCSPRSRDS
jgi:ABC-type branched-subunit amino acid transport system permease subunit